MDIATIIGLILGFGAVFGGQVLEGGHVSALLKPTAALIVLGGTFGATFVSFPLNNIIKACKDVVQVFIPPQQDPEQVIRQIVGYANKARKNGLIALDEDAKQIKDQFMKQGMEMLVDGMASEEIVDILQIEMTNFEESNKISAEVFEAAGGFAPTIGIIGAVLGLIHVMSNLSDTSALGAGIAVAFVATIYGLMTANIICLPISSKIKKRIKEQGLVKEIIVEGLASILKGENPRLIEKRLRGFTLTKDISTVDEQKGKG
jgi:chemotaxis protein MotA